MLWNDKIAAHVTKTEAAQAKAVLLLSAPQIRVRSASDGPEQLRLVAIADSQQVLVVRDVFDLD
jgi:hypothetical protein